MKIKDLIKKQWKNLTVVFFYILFASLVYGIWFDSLWHLWYIDFITVLVIVIIGCIIGYFYIKSELKHDDASKKVEEKNNEVIEKNNDNWYNYFVYF